MITRTSLSSVMANDGDEEDEVMLLPRRPPPPRVFINAGLRGLLADDEPILAVRGRAGGDDDDVMMTP